MSASYWDAPFLSPLLMHLPNPLKRARSTESLERGFKRSKPFEPDTTAKENNVYPVIKTVSISTKTPPSQYGRVNQLLHSIHVERFGDPEMRESWWKEEKDVEMEDRNEHYTAHNSILRQVFLERQMHKSLS